MIRMIKSSPGLLPLALVLAMAVTLGACASKKPEYVERPVEELYNEAMDAMEEKDFARATAKFDEVERQHPYSLWANKAQLMAAYSYYLNNRYDDAIVALDRFIQLHPTSPDIAYAYYLKGLSFYEQISDVARDQLMTELAMKTLTELVKRFPQSKYARDAKLKLDLTRDHLAGKEMEIGRYYLNKGEYLAAINRFRVVIDKYQTTTHVPEALHRLTEAYLAFGLNTEAQKTASVLGYNFPGSEWYMDSYKLMGNEVAEPKENNPWYKPW
jgi:outer membrane protein assembly factor BamD